MSFENILQLNDNNLYCHELTCNTFNFSGSLNLSGDIVIEGDVSIDGNLDVNGNILSGGYVYAGNKTFQRKGLTNASAGNTVINSAAITQSINYATGNDLGSVTFSMPDASDIISDNSLSSLPNGSTFTFLLGNLATGNSFLTLVNSSGGSTVVKPNIYLPINPSGTTFRTCTAVINSVSSPQIDIY